MYLCFCFCFWFCFWFCLCLCVCSEVSVFVVFFEINQITSLSTIKSKELNCWIILKHEYRTEKKIFNTKKKWKSKNNLFFFLFEYKRGQPKRGEGEGGVRKLYYKNGIETEHILVCNVAKLIRLFKAFSLLLFFCFCLYFCYFSYFFFVFSLFTIFFLLLSIFTVPF